MKKTADKKTLDPIEYRKSENLSCELMARRCEVSTRTIISLESGMLSPSLRTAIKLTKGYPYSLDDIAEICSEAMAVDEPCTLVKK